MREINTDFYTPGPSQILYLGIFCCIVFIFTSSINQTLGYILQPSFYLIYYWFYCKSLKKHNLVLAAFLASAYVGEVCLLTDVHKYFTIILVTFFIAAAAMLYTFIPILRIRPRKITKEMVLQPIIEVIFCTYTVIYLMSMYYNSVPNKFLFVFGAIFLLIFTLICFLIPLRNSHPSNVYLYLIGGGLLLEAILAFVYTYSMPITIIATGVKIAICVHKTCVVIYYVRIEKIRTDIGYDDY
ncbi:hypothetical protein ACFSYG_18395 [Leeuwenhoekiella polynyae]|uniref:YhhN-like protein n=1 Tax=Leeuwenhoekiella polynyae TaxID=1550906 RepID=A0A4Q0PB16_9FLAO|nr:hypothetical protein [Leeuwenhoekiella polynyae]RXG23974.1 hypothetical protein DSM02_1459 [Leeuwenhoekiella polynyae]